MAIESSWVFPLNMVDLSKAMLVITRQNVKLLPSRLVEPNGGLLAPRFLRRYYRFQLGVFCQYGLYPEICVSTHQHNCWTWSIGPNLNLVLSVVIAEFSSPIAMVGWNPPPAPPWSTWSLREVGSCSRRDPDPRARRFLADGARLEMQRELGKI